MTTHVPTSLSKNGHSYSSNEGESEEVEEVVVCSSSSSFKRKSSFLGSKPKSRIMQPPEYDRRAKGFLKSRVSGESRESDEDDPFLEDDLPEEYKKMKLSKWAMVQLVSLILIIAALACTLSIFKKKTLFRLELWKWLVLVFVLICGRLVSAWGIRVSVFLMERNILLRKRFLYFVYGSRNAVENCIWLGLVLTAWKCLFDQKVKRLTDTRVLVYLTNIWVCLLVATLIWFVKTVVVKVLASSFNVSTFFDRIQESLFNQYVIETLSGPPLVEIQLKQEEEEKVMAEVQELQNAGTSMPPELRASVFQWSGTPRKRPMAVKSPGFTTVMSDKEDKRINIDLLHRLNQKNISAWNMKRLMNIVRKGVLSTLDEKLQDSSGEDESTVITSECQAKAAAKKIFGNVARPGSK